MPSVKVREGEPFDSAVRRFKRAVEKAGIPKELRGREFHQKGSTLKQRRKAAARKRLLKRLYNERVSLGLAGNSNRRDRKH
jgi:small subunit ribosomal protein S21